MGLPNDVQQIVDQVRDALGSSLDIRAVVTEAAPHLLRAIRADYAALGVTRPGAPGEFDWVLAKMPEQFFQAYPTMAEHDFVLRSVLGSPNRVLRDTEMLPRRDLERNPMYGCARDLGMPLEQVMSTMLHADGEWSSGISLYRANRRPFSERDREVLEAIAPSLRHAVRNCRLFADMERRARTLDAIIEKEGLAVVVFSTRGHEVARSESVGDLLRRYFAQEDRGPDWLPAPLLDEVGRWVRLERDRRQPPELLRRAEGRTLSIRPYWLSERGLEYVVVALRESTDAPPVPSDWQERLTPREQQVAESLLRGWDNRLIAQQLGCAEATVKKHVSRVFDKLGADQRAQLIARAARTPR